MTIVGSWSQQAMLAAFHYVAGNLTDSLPLAYQVRLYSTTADPDGSDPNTELTADNYAPQDYTADLSTPLVMVNAADIAFSDLSACSVVGIGLCDASDGTIWYWWDSSAPIAITDGGEVSIATGELLVQMLAGA